ncbi:AP2 domain-containing protein [Rhodococcus pyridinivorans]|uniref:AP2 domain-containing protein n=1 Tax=Rhodococcus pyridinivorans TaxID=103816 RepID=UPI00280B8CDB|nr:AP2 domain-containing protein [Rhodococcus pyridinivorans]WMM74495.1 AP2 domain-containing protein [Rhodococcus pyridinivorans]
MRLLMHRVLTGAKADQEVDHEDRNPLNNQRSNLRKSTRTNNNRNSGPRNGSQYKGAKFHKGKKRWEATIRVDECNQYLGSFDSGEEAAIAYDVAAIQVFGEFAYLNIIGRQS